MRALSLLLLAALLVVGPAASPYNFTFTVPSGWTNVQVYHTLTMPAYVVEDGPVPVTGSTFTYQYNPSNVSRRFPSYENDGFDNGPTVSDPLVLTMTVTGTDADGRFQVRDRVFNILHDRILSLD